MQQTFEILQCDKPTDKNGRIYSRDMVQSAIDDYMNNSNSNFFGLLGIPNDVFFDLSSVSHKVLDMRIDDRGYWMCSIEVLDTPAATIYKTLHNITDFNLSFCGTGIVSHKNVVSDLSIMYTVLLHGDQYTNRHFIKLDLG